MVWLYRPAYDNNMMNMTFSFPRAAAYVAILLGIMPAQATEQTASGMQFAITIPGVEKPLVWDGQSLFRAGEFPRSSELEIFPVHPSDHSKLYVNALALKIEPQTTGAGEMKQVVQVPHEMRFKQICNISAGEECLVQNQGQVVARILRTR